MKKLLIVVDYKNDFVSGSLGFPEAEALEPKLHKKVQDYLDAKDDVVYTMDTHGENYLDTREGQKLPVPHCIRGTDGWQICEEVQERIRPQDRIVDKVTFGAPDLPDIIRAECGGMPEEIHLAGVWTDICVISNAMICKAAFPEVPVFIHERCCAGVTPESHATALEAMRACQIDIL